MTYVVLAHLSALAEAPLLQALALTVLAAALLYRQLVLPRPAAWLALAGLTAACLALTYAGGGRYALYLPSIVLLWLAGSAFFSSLLPGQTPLITRIAASAQTLPPHVAAYTRGLTWCWAAIIAAAFVLNLYLIAAGPVQRWSAYANGYVYLAFFAVFAVEYAWRRLRFRGLEQPGLLAYIRLLLRQRAETL